MDKFGFIVHPVVVENIKKTFPFLRIFPSSWIKSTVPYLPPFQLHYIDGIRSKTGKEIGGYFIVCPLFPNHFLDLKEDFVIKKILAAARIAKKLNVQMLGLGSLSGMIGEAGKKVAEGSGLPITNGTTYAGSACLDTVLHATQLRNVDLSNAKVAIIGATNCIGKICSYVLSKKVAHLCLAGSNKERLAALCDKLCSETSSKIENSSSEVAGAIRNADIVIFTTTAVEVSPHIEVENLKEGSIICDIPVPRNITPDIVKARPDLLVIDGAAIEPPCELKLKFESGLAGKQIYACMAETMILTLEGKFENFSVGWEPSLEKVGLIRCLAEKHGFTPAFTSFGRKIA